MYREGSHCKKDAVPILPMIGTYQLAKNKKLNVNNCHGNRRFFLHLLFPDRRFSPLHFPRIFNAEGFPTARNSTGSPSTALPSPAAAGSHITTIRPGDNDLNFDTVTIEAKNVTLSGFRIEGHQINQAARNGNPDALRRAIIVEAEGATISNCQIFGD